MATHTPLSAPITLEPVQVDAGLEEQERAQAERFTPLSFLRFALTLILVWALVCWVLRSLMQP